MVTEKNQNSHMYMLINDPVLFYVCNIKILFELEFLISAPFLKGAWILNSALLGCFLRLNRLHQNFLDVIVGSLV